MSTSGGDAYVNLDKVQGRNMLLVEDLRDGEDALRRDVDELMVIDVPTAPVAHRVKGPRDVCVHGSHLVAPAQPSWQATRHATSRKKVGLSSRLNGTRVSPVHANLCASLVGCSGIHLAQAGALGNALKVRGNNFDRDARQVGQLGRSVEVRAADF